MRESPIGPSDFDEQAEMLERTAARGFVAAGGVFWVLVAFAGPRFFQGMDATEAVKVAAWPFLATVVILGIGWWDERLAADLLLAAAAAVVVWGILYGWEPGVWAIMSIVLIAPMVMAAVLFILAWRAAVRRSEHIRHAEA